MGEASLERVAECLYRNHRGVYFALVKASGKQIKRSLRTKDRATANRLLGDFRRKVERLQASGERDLRFNALCDLWLASIHSQIKESSYVRRVSSINQMRPFFKNAMVRSITIDQIDQWKTERSKEVSARSFNIDMETLSLLFRYAKEIKRIILDNPTEHLQRKKEPRRTHTIPTRDQFKVLLTELKNCLQASTPGGAADLIEFLAYSGCRLGEAIEVRWQDVNLKLETLLITGGDNLTKNSEHRTIPLFPPLKSFLERLKRRNGDDKLFAVTHSRQALIGACKRAGLPRFGHHAMRHFFCSNAIEAGIDFKVIAGWLGHKDGGILVARTYGHLRAEHSAEMAKRMTFGVGQE